MVDLEEVFEVIDRFDQDRIMDLMKLVIGVDTTAPPGDTYREYVDKISPYFSELGYNLEEVVVPEELVKEIPYPLEGPRINLVATKNFGQDKDISFYGHMDVVPAPYQLQMMERKSGDTLLLKQQSLKRVRFMAVELLI
ncbi:MAG: hypothetical protein ACTSPS_18970 [Promethearchaeota archaeon]